MEKNIEKFYNLKVNGMCSISIVNSEVPFISCIDVEKLNYTILKETLSIYNNDCKTIVIGTNNLKSIELINNTSVVIDDDCVSDAKFNCQLSKGSKTSFGFNETKKLKISIDNDSKFQGQFFKSYKTDIIIKNGGEVVINCDGEINSEITGSGSVSNYGDAIKNNSKSISE